MPLKFRINRWWIVAVPAAVILLAWLLISVRSNEPVYQGRRLGSWLRGHPKEYVPAVLAVGTNALPYLLTEFRATDSRASQWGQSVLAKVSMGPFWRTAPVRRYQAGLGLQILDTNAVPALVEMIFSQPMQIVEGDPSYTAALALTWLGSTASQQQVCERLAQELHDSDPAQRRNACLTLSLWSYPGEDFATPLATVSRDENATVRAAAVRAIIFSRWKEDLFLPVLVSRLEDEQVAVRRLAVDALNHRGSNAVVALPALHAAYSNELTRPNLRIDLMDGYYGVHGSSAQEIRSAIRNAINAIDPNAPLPSDPP